MSANVCVRLYLHYSSRSLLCHVVDSILVSQPVRSLHCVVEMPSPIILLHVPQSGIDTTLWSNIQQLNINKETTLLLYVFN